MVVSADFYLVVYYAVEILFVDWCWEIEIWIRFCLDWVILRLFGVDLLVLGRFLAIGASFSCGYGGRTGDDDGWRLLLSLACLITCLGFVLIWALFV
jgi:hypothetical protein